jgi:hypothetical protein
MKTEHLRNALFSVLRTVGNAPSTGILSLSPGMEHNLAEIAQRTGSLLVNLHDDEADSTRKVEVEKLLKHLADVREARLDDYYSAEDFQALRPGTDNEWKSTILFLDSALRS